MWNSIRKFFGKPRTPLMIDVKECDVRMMLDNAAEVTIPNVRGYVAGNPFSSIHLRRTARDVARDFIDSNEPVNVLSEGVDTYIPRRRVLSYSIINERPYVLTFE